jgi:hypothetical protein
MDKRAMTSAHRQMGAVIAKAMESLESMECLRSLTPLEFDQVRRRVISALWDSYNIGLWLGKKADDGVHGS